MNNFYLSCERVFDWKLIGKPIVVLSNNDGSREKKQVGYQWEKSSAGRCLSLFAVADDDQGRTVQRQIADKIG